MRVDPGFRIACRFSRVCYVIPALYRLRMGKNGYACMRVMIALLLSISLCGCAAPFKRVERVPLRGIDAQDARSRFAQSLPAEFEIINSTVLAYYHWKVSCVGPLSIDTAARSFTLAGLNHMGVKLFDLGLEKGVVQVRYVFPEFARHGDFAGAVCEDIGRIYFDRVPGPESAPVRRSRAVVFRGPFNGGVLEHVFAGRESRLVEKNFYMKGRKLWSVSYYEYFAKDGTVFPAGIVLRNYRYKYRLEIRLKEIRDYE